MERIFPFLHEDVLFIINEYAREHTEKKELCSALFKKYLNINLKQLNIRDKWIHCIDRINFKDLNSFINIIEVSRDSNIKGGEEVYYIKSDYDLECYKDLDIIPMGPKLKIYHYFVNGGRFPPRGSIPTFI